MSFVDLEYDDRIVRFYCQSFLLDSLGNKPMNEQKFSQLKYRFGSSKEWLRRPYCSILFN